MISLHCQLLDEALETSSALVPRLRDAAIYVTGSSGFLAASLLAFLHEMNRRGDLRMKLFASARRPLSEVPLFRFLDMIPEIEWQVASAEESILPAVEDLIVVHTASYGSPRDYLREPFATYQANTLGLERLLTQDRSLRHFVYFSSAEIYGQPPDTEIPTRETYVGGLDTLGPRSIYGESKRMGEVLGNCLAGQKGVPFTALRPWNVYGPGQRMEDGRVPMEFVRQALTTGAIKLASDGTPKRAFCHVWDAIRQIYSTLIPESSCRAFNIGNNSEEISVLDLARLCATATGLPEGSVQFDPNSRAGGLQRCAPDTLLIQTQMKSNHFTSLETGLRTVREWMGFLGRSKNKK